MLNVVIDANVVVSATLKPNSLPYQALVAAIRSDRLCLSQAVADEISGVFERPTFQNRIGASDQVQGVGVLLQSAMMLEPHTTVSEMP